MGDKLDRLIGFCELHYSGVSRSKYDTKCRRRNKGKACKYFTRSIPQWRKDYDRGKGKKRFDSKTETQTYKHNRGNR